MMGQALIFLSLTASLFLIQCQDLWALGVDEKLPLRILKASDTKKTLLINRGIEDGLVLGDHAKFFLTTGVVARGVVIKASPPRSVWSLYRVVSGPDIVADKVMNLKITTAVKLSKDISKMFEEEEHPQGPPEGIVLAEGAEDLDKELQDKDLSPEEKKELQKMKSETTMGQGNTESYISNRTLEFWSMMHLSTLTTTNSTGETGQGTSGSDSSLDFLLGMEKYFLDYQSWLGKISFSPFIHYGKKEYSSIEGHTIKSSLFAFGLGLDYHFWAPPLSVNRAVLFLGPTFGIGSATDAAVLQSTTTTTLPSLNGSVNFFSIGIGIKYFLGNGLGFRTLLDYYQRTETYIIAGSTDKFSKVVKGPRVLLGLSYRF